MQILFTTHSPVVINMLKPHNVVFVNKSDPDGTQFFLLSDPAHVDKVKKVLETGGQMADFVNMLAQ